MATLWHVARNDDKRGPFSSKQLKDMAEKGQILPTDLVWREGLNDWMSATQVKGLFTSSQISDGPFPQPPPLRANKQTNLTVAFSTSLIERLTSDSVTLSISTPAAFDAVQNAVLESLIRIGQTALTVKGEVSVNPKAEYRSFAANATAVTGTIIQTQQGVYDLKVNFQVKPTTACWAIGLIGGMGLAFPALIFIIPFSTAKKALRGDIDQALRQAVRLLGGEVAAVVEPVVVVDSPMQQTDQPLQPYRNDLAPNPSAPNPTTNSSDLWGKTKRGVKSFLTCCYNTIFFKTCPACRQRGGEEIGRKQVGSGQLVESRWDRNANQYRQMVVNVFVFEVTFCCKSCQHRWSAESRIKLLA